MRRSRTAFPSGTPSTVVASGAALSSRRYQVRRPVRVAVLARDPLAGQVLLPNTPGRLVAMHPPENMDAGAGTAHPCATRGRPLLRRGRQSPVADLVDRTGRAVWASVSLFGDGSGLARTLAAALAEGDHVTAFRRYDAEHRRRTDARGRGAGLVAAMLVPKSRAGILVATRQPGCCQPGRPSSTEPPDDDQ